MTSAAEGGRGPHRIPVTLACSECKARNYKTTRSAPNLAGVTGETEKALEIRKYCKQCKHHTLHRETK